MDTQIAYPRFNNYRIYSMPVVVRLWHRIQCVMLVLTAGESTTQVNDDHSCVYYLILLGNVRVSTTRCPGPTFCLCVCLFCLLFLVCFVLFLFWCFISVLFCCFICFVLLFYLFCFIVLFVLFFVFVFVLFW